MNTQFVFDVASPPTECAVAPRQRLAAANYEALYLAAVERAQHNDRVTGLAWKRAQRLAAIRGHRLWNLQPKTDR